MAAARKAVIDAREDGRPFVVVHGGAESQRYRNVLEALESALACEADYFEFDVRALADGAIVVHHDEAIETAALSGMTLAAATTAAAACGYELPLLDRILTRACNRLRLDVELKACGYEANVLEQLRRHGFARTQFVVTSFEQRALAAVHSLDPQIATGLLVYDMTGRQALDCFRASAATFLGPDHAILDDETLGEAARAGVRLMPWTVNDETAMRRLLVSPAVVGVITDAPATAIRVRAESAR